MGLECNCGCGRDAEWLISGYDYDPKGPNGRGQAFHKEPACTSAARYCQEASAELKFPFYMAAYDQTV